MFKTSASKLKTYTLCPKMYHWQTNLKLLQPKNKAFVIGTAYHDLVEKFHNCEPSNIEEYDDEKLKEILTRLMSKYEKKPVEGTVVDTEKRFEISHENVVVRGIIDRLDIDKIVEYKTSSFDYTEEDIDNWQTDLYIWYIWKTTGMIFPMTYSVMNKVKAKTIKYVPQIIVATKTEEELLQIEVNLVEIVAKIENGEFEEKQGPQCGYCPFGSNYMGTKNCPHTYVKPRKTKKKKKPVVAETTKITEKTKKEKDDTNWRELKK